MSDKHFIPTKGSLSLAKSIADSLDIPFDEDLTHHQGIWLLDLYFKEICNILPNETQNIQFENLATRDFAAFIEPTSSKPLVFMDQQFQFFLLSTFFINAIWACRVLDSETKNELRSLFTETISTLQNPYLHESLREKEIELMQRYKQELLLANTLTISALAFIMCHEIAHENLDHMTQPESRSQEFEADKLAFSYLVRISENFEKMPNLKIAPNKLGAPILAFEYLAKSLPSHAIEALQGAHPSPLSRGEKLHGFFKGMADDEAIYLYDGFRKSLDEITCSE